MLRAPLTLLLSLILQQQRNPDALVKIQRFFFFLVSLLVILVSKITEGGKDQGQKEGFLRMVMIIYVQADVFWVFSCDAPKGILCFTKCLIIFILPTIVAFASHAIRHKHRDRYSTYNTGSIDAVSTSSYYWLSQCHSSMHLFFFQVFMV